MSHKNPDLGHPPDAPDFQSSWFVTEGDRLFVHPLNYLEKKNLDQNRAIYEYSSLLHVLSSFEHHPHLFELFLHAYGYPQGASLSGFFPGFN